MAQEATFVRSSREFLWQVGQSAAAWELYQLPDGRAAYLGRDAAASTNDQVTFISDGKVFLPKASSTVLLPGGDAFWDASASNITYKKVDDRDYYAGRICPNVSGATAGTGDWAANDTQVLVDLNIDPRYDYNLMRDPFVTAIIGTQALTTTGLQLLTRGGALDVLLSSTSEAQKVDALALGGFSTAANAIIEFNFNVPSDGAGTVVDVSVGAASATHATDADSIAQHLFMHLDANNTNINFQSKDGSTTVTSTDSTTDYTEGQTLATSKEVWFDMRNPASVKIYVDAVQVLSGTTFDVSAGASTWKLLLHIEKTSAADTYEFQLNKLRARLMEQ